MGNGRGRAGRVVGQSTAGAIGRLRNRAGGFTTLLARARGNNQRRRRRPGARVR